MPRKRKKKNPLEELEALQATSGDPDLSKKDLRDVLSEEIPPSPTSPDTVSANAITDEIAGAEATQTAEETVKSESLGPETVEEAEEDLKNIRKHAKPKRAPKKSLKTQVQSLIDEAPTLQQVKMSPWDYTEWLARLNTAVMNS